MKNKVTVFVLDDNLPPLPHFVDRHVYDAAIGKNELAELVEKGDWTDNYELREVVSRLLNHEAVKAGQIDVFGYTNPELALVDVEAGRIPNVIVYDWEYGAPSATESKNWLLELLAGTGAFVFVYSKFRDLIPPTLNKPDFDNFRPKFRLLKKGDDNNSVFTSEDLIDQRVTGSAGKPSSVTVRGRRLNFKENSYVREPSDIVTLEAILGRAVLLQRLEEVGEISDESLVRMFEKMDGFMLFDRKKRFLIAAEYPLGHKQETTERITYVKAIKDFGIEAVKEALETGFAKV